MTNSSTMLIRPIVSEAHHAAAIDQLTELWGKEDDEAKATIDALLTLIDAYEARTWPISDTLDPIDMIKHAMSDDVGHTRAELVDLLGSPSRVSEILSRTRALTLDMIRKISDGWGIPVSLLTKPYELTKGSRARISVSSSKANPTAVGRLIQDGKLAVSGQYAGQNRSNRDAIRSQKQLDRLIVKKMNMTGTGKGRSKTNTATSKRSRPTLKKA